MSPSKLTFPRLLASRIFLRTLSTSWDQISGPFSMAAISATEKSGSLVSGGFSGSRASTNSRPWESHRPLRGDLG